MSAHNEDQCFLLISEIMDRLEQIRDEDRTHSSVPSPPPIWILPGDKRPANNDGQPHSTHMYYARHYAQELIRMIETGNHDKMLDKDMKNELLEALHSVIKCITGSAVIGSLEIVKKSLPPAPPALPVALTGIGVAPEHHKRFFNALLTFGIGEEFTTSMLRERAKGIASERQVSKWLSSWAKINRFVKQTKSGKGGDSAYERIG
jgi:hypothetical protein